MKLRFLLTALTIIGIGTATQVHAQDGVGIGGELVSPVGISYKVPLSNSSAVTGALGALFTDGANRTTIEINYISYRTNDNFDIGSGNLSPYFGGGLSFRFAQGADPAVALRVPFGIEYDIEDAPFEIYMDIGPYLVLTDPLSFNFDSSLGFRYRF